MRLVSVLRVAFLTSCIGLGSMASSKAGPATDACASCITDNTTGRDRKDLVKWIFAALMEHPEIKSFSRLPEVERNKMERSTAVLFERLVTKDCREEARAAFKADGTDSFKTAFGKLGRAAATELMADKGVENSFKRTMDLIDNKKIDAALK